MREARGRRPRCTRCTVTDEGHTGFALLSGVVVYKCGGGSGRLYTIRTRLGGGIHGSFFSLVGVGVPLDEGILLLVRIL